MFWRFGLCLLVLGSFCAADGALLTAWNARWVHFPAKLLMWPVYVFVALVLATASWLAMTSYQEGAWSRPSDPTLAVEHFSLPALIIIAYVALPDRWPGLSQMAVGAALAFCGWRTLRAKSVK